MTNSFELGGFCNLGLFCGELVFRLKTPDSLDLVVTFNGLKGPISLFEDPERAYSDGSESYNWTKMSVDPIKLP